MAAALRACIWTCLVVLSILQFQKHHEVKAVSVSHDQRALKLDGQRRMLISGSIHYPRSTSKMWPGLIAKAKEGGLDVIQTYVFWNVHEPTRGVYDYGGRYNLPEFLRLVQEAGMYVSLRIGPYVCAEWTSGFFDFVWDKYRGFPAWLRFVPGIEFRTDNEPFKMETQRFVNHVVAMLKKEKLLAWQGGPIIMMQIENEYGNIDASYGEPGQRYMNWIADMAVATNASVPWIMCQQPEAPQSVINTCNGFYCDGWRPNSEGKPALWTENWTGWFQGWGKGMPTRPVQDLAFAVARFFQKGGSFQNYYMYHGGTNFERTGVESVTTSYDYDAPIDEFGELSQPKWGHLKDLHAALKLCEAALMAVDTIPAPTSLGPSQEAHVYRSSSSGSCAAFLANWGTNDTATVEFQGQWYDLPAWSVSILPDCTSVVFNTAKVGAQSVTMSMQNATLITNWVSSHEPLGGWGYKFSTNGLLEQIATTKDATDYLWYMTTVQVAEADLSNGSAQGTLILSSLRDVAHTFVNDNYIGTMNANGSKASQTISLRPGDNSITILSMTMGLQGYGPFLEKEKAGIQYGVRIEGLPSGTMELGGSNWTYQVGLQGEKKQLYSFNGSFSADWYRLSEFNDRNSLSWVKTSFDTPAGNGSLALDLSSMGKGQAWVNGRSIGRYWPSFPAHKDGCPATCDYRGVYTQTKCLTKCGQPSQSWYHVPRQWLLPKSNLIVLFEEQGGNPEAISIATPTPHQICSHISESHPLPLSVTSWARRRGSLSSTPPRAPLLLECGDGHYISSISFASYGTPDGGCASGFVTSSSCHANTSADVLSKACVGRQKCAVPIVSSIFGVDPCPGVLKSLAAAAECA